MRLAVVLSRARGIWGEGIPILSPQRLRRFASLLRSVLRDWRLSRQSRKTLLVASAPRSGARVLKSYWDNSCTLQIIEHKLLTGNIQHPAIVQFVAHLVPA